MATEEEVLRYLVEVQNREQLAQLNGLLSQQQAAHSQLKDELARGIITQQQYDAAVQRNIDDQKKLVASILSTQAAMRSGSGGMQNFGQAVMQAGYAIEDLQYGVGGVLNNIPSLLMGLGLGAGLTGAIQILIVGVTQLYKHWDDIAKLWGQAKELDLTTASVEKLTERIKKLEEQTVRTAQETNELTQARIRLREEQEREKGVQSLQDQQAELQRKQGAVIREAVTEQGGGLDAVAKALMQAVARDEGEAGLDKRASKEALAARAEALDELHRMQNSLDAARASGNKDFAASIEAAMPKTVDKLNTAVDKLREEVLESFRKQVGGAAQGRDVDLQALLKAAEFQSNLFKPGFAAAAMGAQENNVRAGMAADQKHLADQQKQYQEEIKARQKLIADLERQGEEGEKVARAQAAAMALDKGKPNVFETEDQRIAREAQDREKQRQANQKDNERLEQQRGKADEKDREAVDKALQAAGPGLFPAMAQSVLQDQTQRPRTPKQRAEQERRHTAEQTALARALQAQFLAQGVDQGKAEQLSGEAAKVLVEKFRAGQTLLMRKGLNAQQATLALMSGFVQDVNNIERALTGVMNEQRQVRRARRRGAVQNRGLLQNIGGP
jgi:hypothetical protein